MDCIEEHGLTQLVNFTTHVRGGLLDAAFAPHTHHITSIFNASNIGNSDHCSIFVDIGKNVFDIGLKDKVRCWQKGDKTGLSNYLRAQDWSECLVAEDVWDSMKSKIEVGVNNFIPLVNRKENNSPPWVTRAVKNACNTKRRHFKIYLNNRTSDNFKQYKTSEKKC